MRTFSETGSGKTKHAEDQANTCPTCGRRAEVYRTIGATRYRKCGTCGERYSTIEVRKVKCPPMPRPLAEQLAEIVKQAA